MIEKIPILTQITLECIEDSLLSEGRSLRVKRDKKNRIRRIGVFGYTKAGAPCKAQPEPVIVKEYVWRPV